MSEQAKQAATTMKLKEAAKYYGYSEYMLRLLAKQGKIPHLKAGNRFLFRKESLDKWLEQQEQASIQSDQENEAGHGTLRRIQ